MNFDYDVTLLLLIFARMSGCILFNPILGRRNIPFAVKGGLALMLSFFTYPLVPRQSFAAPSPLVLGLCVIRELLIGFAVGFVIQLFMSVIVMGGEQMDMQIGISMSRVYDPQSNVSMPLSASAVNALFLLLFFATNAHLTLIRVFVRLGAAVPYGDGLIPPEVGRDLAGAFAQMLVYAAKLSLPIIAVEMVSQIGIGLVTKAVPQIDIFTVEIQLKILIGFAAIVALAPPFANFIEKLIGLMFDCISGVYALLT